jgi:hypothetical protein
MLRVIVAVGLLALLIGLNVQAGSLEKRKCVEIKDG